MRIKRVTGTFYCQKLSWTKDHGKNLSNCLSAESSNYVTNNACTGSCKLAISIRFTVFPGVDIITASP